jgi:hypothetical protein
MLETVRNLALTLLFGSAMSCSTTLSSLQTAKTLDPGQVRLSAGVGLYVPATQGVKVIAQGVELTQRTAASLARNEAPTLSTDDEQAALTSALALALFPPSSQFEAMLRVGLWRNIDVGLKLSSNALRFDARYRLFHSSRYEQNDQFSEVPHEAGFLKSIGQDGKRDSTDVTLGVGLSRYLFKNPILDVLKYVKLGDFSRWDVDGTLYFSRDFLKYFGLYGAVKYVWSHTETDQTLVRFSQAASEITQTSIQVPAVLNTQFLGGTVGLRAGIPQISFFLELTVGNTWAVARVLEAQRDFGGITVYPALGFASAF